MTQLNNQKALQATDSGRDGATVVPQQPEKVEPHVPEPHSSIAPPTNTVKTASYISDKTLRTRLDIDETQNEELNQTTKDLLKEHGLIDKRNVFFDRAPTDDECIAAN
jgi:hypothetical protein